MYVRMYVCMYVRTYVCMYVYMYIYKYVVVTSFVTRLDNVWQVSACFVLELSWSFDAQKNFPNLSIGWTIYEGSFAATHMFNIKDLYDNLTCWV